MTDNSAFAEEFTKAFNDPTQDRKGLGKAIGLPDKKDEEYIGKLVAKYEAENPGWLKWMRDNARKEFEAGHAGSLRNETGLLDKASSRTYDFELPPTFYALIEKHYPLMFRDINHYRWFKKTFVALMIRPNTKRRMRK